VVNSYGSNFFLEVKFRSVAEWLFRDKRLKQSKEYRQSKLILVTIEKPYFRVVDTPSLTGNQCAFERLEADEDFHVTREALETFAPLVECFLLNGTATSRSTANT
jgi:hypothetical protein